MRIFNSGFFWFVEGILLSLMVLGLSAWARDRSLPMPAWKWLVFLVWVAFTGFTIAFVGTSLGEGEPTAATRGGILFGLIAIIGGVGVWRALMTGGGSIGGGSREGEATQEP
jgi:hypothetical protein